MGKSYEVTGGASAKENTKKIYYRKRVDFFKLLQKIKIWPSRKGILHGIKSIRIVGNQAQITTHCNETFVAYNSKNSRAARCLRNKWGFSVCRTCRIPSWKLQKYHSTFFHQHYGSDLSPGKVDK